ncbi:MAG: FG-GAP-like repeat-containing protein [Phycisphaerae bacterium]
MKPRGLGAPSVRLVAGWGTLFGTLISVGSVHGEPCDQSCYPQDLAVCPIPLLRAHVDFPVQFTARHNWNGAACSLPGPLTWSVVDGPNDFGIDGAGGLFYWTPTETGIHEITVKVSVIGHPDLYATQTFTAVVDNSTITYPLWRDYVGDQQVMEVLGRATDAGDAKFVSYYLLAAPMPTPHTMPDDEGWQLVAGPFDDEVEETGLLAEWDVSSIQDGARYALRLVVNLRDGSQSIVDNQIIFDRTSIEGWPKRVGPISHSVVAADLDDDNRDEIMVVTHHGELHVWNIDGSERFTMDIGGATYSAPSVGDIDGDKRPEIVWTIAAAPGYSKLVACHDDGTMVEGFPVTGPEGRTFRVSPTLSDLDSDGRMEIIVGARAPGCNCGSQFLVYDYDRRTNEPVMMDGWPQTVEPSLWSVYASASTADLDDDGSLDVVVSASGTGTGGAVTKAYAFAADGQAIAGWEGGVQLPMNVGSAQTNGAGSPSATSQAAIADLDGDGEYEIVIGANLLSADGQVLATLPYATSALSPAIGDLDSNPYNGLEIAMGHRVYDSEGEWLSWMFPGVTPMTTSIIAPMALGEVTLAGSPRAGWIAPSIQAFFADGDEATNYPKEMFGNTLDAGAPVQGDFDNDGMADVAAAITDGSYGGVVAIWRCPHSENVAETRHWPMLGFDAAHTGRYHVPAPRRPQMFAAARYDDRVVLTWSDSSDVESQYVIERSSSGDPFTFRSLVWLPANSTRFTVWGSFAADGFYRIRAARTDPTSGERILSRFQIEQDVEPDAPSDPIPVEAPEQQQQAVQPKGFRVTLRN